MELKAILQKFRIEYFWLIGIILFIALGSYAEPIADDYAYAYRLQLKPYWSAYFHEYFTWNGRYTSNLFVLLNNHLIDNRLIYHIMPGVIIVSLTASLTFLFRSFLTRKDALLLALIATVLYLGSNARISEVIYWYTATVTYTMGTILTILAVGSLIRFDKTHKFIWGLGACLFLLLSSGTNEISMAINILVALAYSLRRHFRWPIVIATAIIAAGLVYFAPGNDVRTGFFPNAHNILYSLGMSALQTIRFTALSISYLPIPITILLLWRNVDFNDSYKALTTRIKNIHFLWFLIAIFTPLFLSAFLPYYATGLLGQHRTMAFGQLYLTLGLLAIPLIVSIKFPNPYHNMKRRLQKIPNGIYIATIILSFLFMGNSQKAWFEAANGALATQQKELIDRENQIRNATENKTLYFQPLDTTLLFVIDLDQNPEHWINKHQSTVLNPEFTVRTTVTPPATSHKPQATRHKPQATSH